MSPILPLHLRKQYGNGNGRLGQQFVPEPLFGFPADGRVVE
jgi:hypothetical protein